MIRVLVADDHRLVREGVQALLKKAEDVEIVGEACDGKEAVDLTKRLHPDVLLIDLSMPGQDGFQTLGLVQSLALPTHVLVFSMWSDQDKVREALQAGAEGYVLKNWKRDELVGGIRAVSRGEKYLSPSLASEIAPDN